MRILIAHAVVYAFGALSLLHVYWVLGGIHGKSVAIPRLGDSPAFSPSATATFAVAAALACCALTLACLANIVPLPIGQAVLRWLGYAIAAVLALRAVGDFHLVGFFKRARGSPFALLDTFVFSPLCLLLAAGTVYVIRAS